MKRNRYRVWVDWEYWVQMNQIICDRCLIPSAYIIASLI